MRSVVRQRLLVKAVLGLVVVILLASLIAGYFFVGINDNLDRQVERQITATTELHVDVYDRWFESQRTKLRSIATTIDADEKTREEVRRLLRTERLDDEQITHLHYVDTATGEILTSSADTAIGETVPDETGVLRNQEFVVPEQYTNQNNQTVFALGQSVPFQERVIIAEYEVDDAGPTLNQPIRGATTSVVTPDGGTLIGTATQPPDGVDTSVTLQQTDTEIRGYHRLSSVDVVVVTQTPRDTAFDIRDTVLRSFALTIVLSFAILIGAVVVGGRSLLNDVTRISRIVQEISDGNLDVSVSTERDDEIGDLYRGVDQMRESLATRIEELTEARDEAETAKQQAERRQLELQRQNDRLDQFASVISHDLRNPLNVAQLQIDLVRDEVDSENAAKVEQALDRMETMVEELLTMARADIDEDDLEDIVVAEFATEAWSTVQTGDSTLQTASADGVTVEGDPDLLRNVFENLFRNAIEHNPRQVTVTVGALEEDDGFYVEDDGQGVPEAEREYLFEHGYTTSDEGTGFGLSIVEEFLAAHGWSIAITEGTDGGARFEIRTGKN
jgi:signal transduction histidine kinase